MAKAMLDFDAIKAQLNADFWAAHEKRMAAMKPNRAGKSEYAKRAAESREPFRSFTPAPLIFIDEEPSDAYRFASQGMEHAP